MSESILSPLQILLEKKRQSYGDDGFHPNFIPDAAFDFQRALIIWAVKKGRAGIFADCGLGKSLMEAAFAQNVVEKTNKRVLILTPLAVSSQMVAEAAKFGVEAVRCNDGKLKDGDKVIVTNYERLHYFNPADFVGAICDESSILKNCDGATSAMVTDFMRKMSYRLLCTATPSPNDLIELGTSSEALGYMGFNDMLSTFFKKNDKSSTRSDEFRSGMWRFRGHAEREFFRWVCSWARAVRKPSDLGFDDAGFDLPELIVNETITECDTPPDGFLFTVPACGLSEQRSERRRTLEVRCEAAAELINKNKGPSVAWCSLNDEGDMLEDLITGAVQVAGKDSMEAKEEALNAFSRGEIKTIVTKPDIAGFGLNWQHCAHQTFFPSHSFEQYHQAVRRSWRFGQTRTVVIDIVTSVGEQEIMDNLKRKSATAEKLFTNLVKLMGDENALTQKDTHTNTLNTPSWLK